MPPIAPTTIPPMASSSMPPLPHPGIDSGKHHIDGGAPFPGISMPPLGANISSPTIRIHDSGDPDARSLPPRPLSLAPRPATARTRPALVGVLCLSLGALAVIRPSFSDLGLANAATPPAMGHGSFAQSYDVRAFLRGNLHTHTTLSDGRDSPRDVVTWYRDHGYQFLALSDHDKLADIRELADLEGPGFTLLPGEEITSSVGSDAVPVHITAVCIQSVIPSGRFDDGRDALAAAVGAIGAQRGFAIVNHPNFKWGLGTSDIASLSGAYGLEVWSGHPDVHQYGDPFHASHEQTWDELLVRGRDVSAFGADDMHKLTPEKPAATEPLPGRAWIATFGSDTSRAAICDAIANGRSYVSTGVTLGRIAVAARTLSIWVDDGRAVVEFVGAGGEVLDRRPMSEATRSSDGFVASYTLRGGERYVRARALVDGGGGAWTQAYRVVR